MKKHRFIKELIESIEMIIAGLFIYSIFIPALNNKKQQAAAILSVKIGSIVPTLVFTMGIIKLIIALSKFYLSEEQLLKV